MIPTMSNFGCEAKDTSQESNVAKKMGFTVNLLRPVNSTRWGFDMFVPYQLGTVQLLI